MEQPGKYWRNNVAGTVELIEACLAADVDDSCSRRRARCTARPSRCPSPRPRRSRPRASTPRRRRWSSGSCAGTAPRTGLRSVSLRYFNAAGASFDARIGEDWTYSINLIPLVMKAVLLGDRRLQVFGDDYDTPDGTCIRDYIHVDDLADAHVKALDYLAARRRHRRGQRRHRRRLVGARGASTRSSGWPVTGAVRHRRPPRRRSGQHLRRPDVRRRDTRLARRARPRRHREVGVRLASEQRLTNSRRHRVDVGRHGTTSQHSAERAESEQPAT